MIFIFYISTSRCVSSYARYIEKCSNREIYYDVIGPRFKSDSPIFQTRSHFPDLDRFMLNLDLEFGSFIFSP